MALSSYSWWCRCAHHHSHDRNENYCREMCSNGENMCNNFAFYFRCEQRRRRRRHRRCTSWHVIWLLLSFSNTRRRGIHWAACITSFRLKQPPVIERKNVFLSLLSFPSHRKWRRNTFLGSFRARDGWMERKWRMKKKCLQMAINTPLAFCVVPHLQLLRNIFHFFCVCFVLFGLSDIRRMESADTNKYSCEIEIKTIIRRERHFSHLNQSSFRSLSSPAHISWLISVLNHSEWLIRVNYEVT